MARAAFPSRTGSFSRVEEKFRDTLTFAGREMNRIMRGQWEVFGEWDGVSGSEP